MHLKKVSVLVCQEGSVHTCVYRLESKLWMLAESTRMSEQHSVLNIDPLSKHQLD